MNIGIDVRKYDDFGIGTYIRNLALYFDRQEADHFTYIASPGDAARIRQTHRGTTLSNSSGKYSLRELYSVSLQANRADISVFHVPHYTLPFGLSMRTVVTIHDIIHLRFPEYFSPLQRAYARMMIGHACRKADAVIVDSEFGGSELLRMIPSARGKITVIPLGVSGAFRPGGTEPEAAAFRKAHDLGETFLLYVGSLKPHKNVTALVRALSRLRDRQDVRLACVGERLEEDRGLHTLIRAAGVAARVRSLGWLSEPALIAAYRAAAAVVLPSLYEGFGFPVLEAMACGTPVIASNSASIPEVVGDAGILFNPAAEGELDVAIRSILDDGGLRRSLSEKGPGRARLFTWDKCAERTLNLYRSLA